MLSELCDAYTVREWLELFIDTQRKNGATRVVVGPIEVEFGSHVAKDAQEEKEKTEEEKMREREEIRMWSV